MGIYPVSNLKEIRKEKYRKTKEFAEKTGLCRRTIERAERGDSLTPYSIAMIAFALEVDKEEIIDKDKSFSHYKIDNLVLNKENNQTPCFKLGMKNYNNLNGIRKKVKVRYMGKSGTLYLEGDKLNTLFFTTDMNKNLDDCRINISMQMKESNFIKLVDKMYEKYKNKPLDTKDINLSLLNEKNIELLNGKAVSLRLGEEVIMRIIEEEYMEIIDFYPKAKLTCTDEIYDLIQSLLCKLDKDKTISLTDPIIPMGFEIIDKIIRCSLMGSENICKFINDSLEDFLLLRELFIVMTYILINYIENEISEVEAQNLIHETYSKIILNINILVKLYELYKFEKLAIILNMERNQISV